MITDRRLLMLLCIYMDEPYMFSDSNMQWLVDQGYVDPEDRAALTQKGTMTVQYAIKKAGEI